MNKAAEWLHEHLKDLKNRAIFEFELEAKMELHGAVTIEIHCEDGNYSYEIKGVE